MIPIAAFALAGCLAVGAGNDQILAGDLAGRLPEWAAVPPETPLGLAPGPGVQRVFRLPELRRLAERFGVPVTAGPEVCVTRPVAVFTAERLLVAFSLDRPTPATLITYLNRLSDWLFVQARWANQVLGVEDVMWKPK